MSIEPGPGLRTTSPANSGRASPAFRTSRQLAEQGIDPKDKSYRRYASTVERALMSFDITQQQWADYISFLARLLKALQSHPAGVQIVPDSCTVATRLAQCLSPDLPSGVHQKALEVYNYIFELIGNNNLGRDIHLYLPGLTPVLSFAALSVRPLYLRLIQTHLVSLDPNILRSPLKATILCLLPGLEDESSEDHDELVQLLNKIRKSVRKGSGADESNTGDEAKRDSFFWQCFFLATITNTSRRQGALSYLMKELPKFSNSTKISDAGDQQHSLKIGHLSTAAKAALDPEPGLLIRCLAAGLTDSQPLIQRGFLDLLVTHLPLHSVVLQDMVPKSDLERIVSSAISVVLRRDMSLNRRLWTWLLASDAKHEPENELHSPRDVVSPGSDPISKNAAYFGKFGLKPLTSCILRQFASTSTSSVTRAKPFKLCLSMMDRWEVGGFMIPDVFIPALQSAYEFSKSAEKSQAEEVVKSASQFFDGVESGIIWAKFNQLVATAYQKGSSRDERKTPLKLAEFIVHRFNIREEEMVAQHIPHSILFLLVHTKISIEENGNADEIDRLALEVLEKLLSLVPSRVFSNPEGHTNGTQVPAEVTSLVGAEIIERMNGHYSEHYGGLDGSPAPLQSNGLGYLILRESASLLMHLFMRNQTEIAIEPVSKILCSVLLRVPHSEEVVAELSVFDYLISAVQQYQASETSKMMPFRALAAVTSLLTASQSAPDAESLAKLEKIYELQNLVVEQLWYHLNPYCPKHHVEAVRCLWQLESVSSTQNAVEAALTTLVLRDIEQSHQQKISSIAGRRFAVLWTHSTLDKTLPVEKGQRMILRRTSSSLLSSGQSVIPSDPTNVLSRPLFILLSHLTDEGTDLCVFLKSWVQELPNINRLLVIHLSKLRSCHGSLQRPNTYKSQTTTISSLSQTWDMKQCLYFTKLLLAILRNASDNIWMTLAAETMNNIEDKKNSKSSTSLQAFMVHLSLKALDWQELEGTRGVIHDLQRVSLDIIRALLQGPYSSPLKDLNLQVELLQRLFANVDTMDPLLQALLLESASLALRLHFAADLQRPQSPNVARRTSKDLVSLPPNVNTSKEKLPREISKKETVLPRTLLIDCLKAGFQSRNARSVLDSWVTFLVDILPVFEDAIFQNLIPLVECVCAEVTLVFNQLRATFRPNGPSDTISPEPTLISLLNALENVLATGHQRLLVEEGRSPNPKSPDQPQGFFGNMVQGVFNADAQGNRKSVGNNRLTVLLCFQDAVRTCFAIWRWGIYAEKLEKHDTLAIASYGYTALRMRNRSRRLLEHLFAAEGLECIETLANMWCQPHGPDFEPQSILGLLNVLNGSKPKHTIPAIFNAIYSRTNPGKLDLSQQSSLTTELKDTDLVAFLVEYTKTLDDDSMDEIWTDCAAFLKDVLTNPLPHNQILPSLLVFIAVLAEKVNNTNFGEQKRTRKELGDLFSRVLTATFTTRPMGFLLEPVASGAKRNQVHGGRPRQGQDVLSALLAVVPQLKTILVESDRVQNAVNSITANITGPTIRAKAFPSNVDATFLAVLQQLTHITNGSKLWKKDISDAFNDTRFFSMPWELVRDYWLHILSEYARNDNDRLPELLTRITAPTTAGLVFGVGATSARLEADRKAQLNLRRVALLLLASPTDTFARNVKDIQERLVELLTASPTSSPSSATRADIFLLLRAIFLKISTLHLGSFWPSVNSELQSALLSVVPESEGFEKYSNASIIQASKLLDLLITLDLDDFQLHEWLFITDTIDAVYRPPDVKTTALIDSIAEDLTKMSSDSEQLDGVMIDNVVISSANGLEIRKPILDSLLAAEALDPADMRAMSKQDLASKILRPYLGQLSLLAFEATYAMLETDINILISSTLKDLFDELNDGDMIR